MNGSKWNAYKNAGWAIGIIVCLLALCVGFFISIFIRYRGEMERSGVHLGPVKVEETITIEAEPAEVPDGSLRQLSEGSDAGQGYIDSLTFLCDSALIGLRDYGVLSGGYATTQVWGSSAGNIPASGLAECIIKYPGDGSEIRAADAAMIAKPSRLVISLGSDGLHGMEQEAFIQGYETLIRDIRNASPSTTIIVCSLSSIAPGYTGADDLTSTDIRMANEWIRQICMDTGVYFADLADTLNDGAETLVADYASANGKALNSAGLNKALEYLRTHTTT